MAEQQAQQSLTQVNQEFAQSRATRLDAAITQALATKLPPAPKAGAKPSPAGSATSRPASSTPASPASASPSASASPAPQAPAAETTGASGSTLTEALDALPPAGSVDAEATGLAPELGATEGAPGSDDQDQDGATEPEQPGFDREAVNAAATKKDLRAVERLLGLTEGVLGATNGEYAALRRRQGEVATGEATLVQNKQQLINTFGPVADLLQKAKGGSIQAYARSIEASTGLPIQVFIEHYARNVQQVDPRTLELQQRLARYEPVDGAPAPQAPAAAPATVATATAKANTYITAELKEHPVLKLRGGLDDVRAKWAASFDGATKTFKLTPAKAAEAVIAERRIAREQEQWILSGKTPPPAQKRRTTTIARAGSSESQPRPERKLSREELIERGAADMRRAKAADAARDAARVKR